MAVPGLSRPVIDQWADRAWRLEHLYWVTDEYGKVVRFKLRPAQRKLLDDLHYLNLVLKARQEGFSTLIVLLALDACIFNSNFAAGLVADTKKNAENLLERGRFAYLSMPAELQRKVSVIKDNTETLVFSNGSSIEVGISLRSSTKNFLHISEYGKICAKSPDKAEEIKSGSLNTLAPKQLAFIESTAEGKGGDFYEKTKMARAIEDSHRDPQPMDWKFHFFPWWAEPRYALTDPYPLTGEDEKYFDALQREHGIKLTPGQEWWYAAKNREQGDAMFKEYPSTADEAFQGTSELSIFGRWFRNLRQLKQIGAFPYVPGIAVNTFWDFGLGDMQSIFLHQEVAGFNRFVGYYENNNRGLAHYFEHFEQWRALRSAVWGKHYAPHDVEHQRQGLKAQTIKEIAKEVGWEFKTVERNPKKTNSIEGARKLLPACQFDEKECSVGIDRLEGYTWEWDKVLARPSNDPKHDINSNGADAFMTFSDGYKPVKGRPVVVVPPPRSFYSR